MPLSSKLSTIENTFFHLGDAVFPPHVNMPPAAKLLQLVKVVGAGVVSWGCAIAASKLPDLREECESGAPSIVQSCNRLDLSWWFWCLEVFVLLGLAMLEVLGMRTNWLLTAPGLLSVGVTVGQDTTNYFAHDSRIPGSGTVGSAFALMTAGNLLLIVALGFQDPPLADIVGGLGDSSGGQMGAGRSSGGARSAIWCLLFLDVVGMAGWIVAMGGARHLCLSSVGDCSGFGLIWWVLALEFVVLVVVCLVTLRGALAHWLSTIVALLAAPMSHLTLCVHSLATHFTPEASRVALIGTLILVVSNFASIICAGLLSTKRLRQIRFTQYPLLLVFRVWLLVLGGVGWLIAMMGVHRGYQELCLDYSDFEIDQLNCDLFNIFWWRFAFQGFVLLGVAFSLVVDFSEVFRIAWIGLLAVASSNPMFFADQFRHYGMVGSGYSDKLGMAGYTILSISFLGLILNLGWLGNGRQVVEPSHDFAHDAEAGDMNLQRASLRESLLFSPPSNSQGSMSVTDDNGSIDLDEDESEEVDIEVYQRSMDYLT